MIESVYAIGDRVVLKGQSYYGEIDRTPSEIMRWIDFYKRMRDRKGGKFAKFYERTIEQLERIYAQETTPKGDQR